MSLPLLQRLKQETAELHEQLEQQLQLLRPSMSVLEYRVLLEQFYGFYLPWEQRAAPLLNQAFPGFFNQRRKAPLLQSDLQFLGSNLAAIPQNSHLPNIQSLPSLMGSLYVLEGATLGGQILARHFERQFNFSGGQGCAFFASYGHDVGRNWLNFCEILTCYSSPDRDNAILSSTIETFDCLGRWLLTESLASY